MEVTETSALIEMYAKCGSMLDAQQGLVIAQARSHIEWTSLISGYARHGHREEALSCFHQMQHESLCPNVVTFVCMLKACGSIGCPYKVLEIEAKVEKQGLLREHVLVGNALIFSQRR